MSARRLWPVLLVVPLAMLAGHQVVYGLLHTGLVPGPHAHSHGHLGLLATLAAPLALAGVAQLARHGGRFRILPALVTLAGAQALAFGAMEAAERTAAGGEMGELLRSPLLWAGVAVQVGVAVALHVGVEVTRRAAGLLLLLVAAPLGAPHPGPAASAPPPGERPPRPLPTLRWLLRRGPPRLLAP